MYQRGYSELRPEDVAQLQAAFGDNWPALAGAYLGLGGDLLPSTVANTLGLEGGRPMQRSCMGLTAGASAAGPARMCMPGPAVPRPAARLDRTQSVLQGHLKCRSRLGSSALPLPTISRSAKGCASFHIHVHTLML